jgi:signal transduction histidine kinase
MSDSGLSTPDTLPDEVIQLREALAAAQRQNEVLSTFVTLTEAAATTEDLSLLAQHAEAVLRQNIPDLLAAYYERQGERWIAQVTTDSVPPDLLALIQNGLPLDTPCFAQTVDARAPQFFDHWDAKEQRVPFTELFHAVGLAPFFKAGEPMAMLTVGFGSGAVWTDQQRHLFTAVYQALEHAQQRTTLIQMQQQQRALEVFMTLTEAIGTETDPLRLAERARALLRVTMAEWSVVFYERQGGLWRAQLADVPDPELRDLLLTGLPDSTPVFQAAVQARQPVFVEHWNAEEQAFPHTESYGKAAITAYFRDGVPAALFVVGNQRRRVWRAEDQAVFETVSRSLGLALDRAWQAQALEQQRGELQVSAARLEHSNQELQAANDELEAFAYSVSHDLRTPVRHVKGFAEVARRAAAKEDAARVRQALDVLEGAADNMNGMIDAMLGLARSVRQPLAHTVVALDVLVADARHAVEDEAEGRTIEWRMGALPQVMGDAATLRQVLVNLLSNAVKFTRPRERAVIEIGTYAGEEAWTVWVRDNGVGFNPAQAGRLFGPFQRLHMHKDFEGTGIGLATSRRIILRHGGRIWASSVPGEGTTFSFTLPHVR